MKLAVSFVIALFLVGAYLYGSQESLWGVPCVLVSAGLALWMSWFLPTSRVRMETRGREEARTQEIERTGIFDGLVPDSVGDESI